MHVSDEEIQKLKDGDQGVFAGMVNEYQHLVYNTVLGIVQQEDDADDITQDVFVQVYLSIQHFRGDAKFSTWLYRIALTKALDHERKRKRRSRLGFVQRLFGGESKNNDDAILFEHPGVLLEQKQNAATLFKAMKNLPEKQRIAFILHKLEGQRYQDIAEIMETSVSSVESLLSRAKSNLRKSLEHLYSKEI